MTEWMIRRWARRGHDRLYAATPGGSDLGYLDVVTGQYHCDDLSNLPLLRAAIADHFESQLQPEERPVSVVAPAAARTAVPGAQPGAQPEAAPATMTAAAPVPAPAFAAGPASVVPPAATGSAQPGPVATPPGLSVTPPGPTWHDLAEVRAGAAARERAIAEREAQGTLRHVLARLLGAKTDERAWRIGADGEEVVAGQLAALGAQWKILHSVRVGERGADIDHVVIGPGGVFTVNSKHHPRAAVWVGGDTFMVDGHRVPYVRNSRHEAKRASRLLAQQVGFPVPVAGLIAVVGANRGFTIKSQPADGAVTVVPYRGIKRFFRNRPQRLSLREIDAIHEVARRSTTWHR